MNNVNGLRRDLLDDLHRWEADLDTTGGLRPSLLYGILVKASAKCELLLRRCVAILSADPTGLAVVEEVGRGKSADGFTLGQCVKVLEQLDSHRTIKAGEKVLGRPDRARLDRISRARSDLVHRRLDPATTIATTLLSDVGDVCRSDLVGILADRDLEEDGHRPTGVGPSGKHVRFPDGTVIRTSAVADRQEVDDWRDYGLYFDSAWAPTWRADVVPWADYGLPSQPEDAALHIRAAFERASDGQHVEIGCTGALGRTGTALACMAILAGVPSEQAVEWVRRNYEASAIETKAQERWVRWFGDFVG